MYHVILKEMIQLHFSKLKEFLDGCGTAKPANGLPGQDEIDPRIKELIGRRNCSANRVAAGVLCVKPGGKL